MPNFPPHLTCVAAVLREILNLKFNHFQLQPLQTIPKNQCFTFLLHIKCSGLPWLILLAYAATPTNPQKDQIFALAVTRKRQVAPERLLQTQSTFSKSVMVSMGVSNLGQMDPIFIDAREKINDAYYCEVLLT